MTSTTHRMLEPFPLKGGDTIALPARGARAPGAHVFDEQSINAIQVARAAGRPLLVAGEPGTGKSQLARAAAQALGVPLVTHVVTGYTQSRDLLWQYDAVARLAEAQLLGAQSRVSLQESEHLLDRLQERNFVTPGPLWFAFDWESAYAIATHGKSVEASLAAIVDSGEDMARNGWRPSKGCVLLIDEIDKAEPDVPNGLLESLGDGRFRPSGFPEIQAKPCDVNLVIVTTNQERALPNAFVRRCVVLRLALPALPPVDAPVENSAFAEYLICRGRAHFSDELVSDAVMLAAARLLATDRRDAITRQAFVPGLAEYLDLLRALGRLAPGSAPKQLELLELCAKYTFDKEPSLADFE